MEEQLWVCSKQAQEHIRLFDVSRGFKELPGALKNTTEDTVEDVTAFVVKYSEGCLVIGVVLGLMVAWNGSHLLRPLVFTIGAVPGAYFFSTVTSVLFESFKYQLVFVIIAGVLGFLLGGWLVMALLLDLGIFLLGAGLGVLISSFLLVFALYKINPENSNPTFYFTSVFIGSMLGLIALSFRSWMIPLSTAFLGSYLSVRCAAHFIGHYPDPINFDPSFGSLWKLIYASAILILGALGCYSQYRDQRSEPKSNVGEEQSLLGANDDNIWTGGFANKGTASGNQVYESPRAQKPDQLRGKYADASQNPPSNTDKDNTDIV